MFNTRRALDFLSGLGLMVLDNVVLHSPSATLLCGTMGVVLEKDVTTCRWDPLGIRQGLRQSFQIRVSSNITYINGLDPTHKTQREKEPSER